MFDDFYLEDLLGLLKWVVIIALCGFGVCKCTQWYDNLPSTKAADAAQAAQDLANRTPHVIREADGCKVYAFQAGDRDTYHYFTRCGDGTVTTERNYDERHGKTTEHKTESIVTQGNS
jgi:hypothetical protein